MILRKQTRFILLCTSLILINAVSCSGFQQESKSKELGADLPKGIVKERPKSGVSFRVAEGYMVPYQETIPGTEIRFTMMPVPRGTYLMGSPKTEKGRKADEGPQFAVSIEPFWMAKCEITCAEFKRYMDLNRSMKELQQSGIRKVTAKNQIDAVTSPSALYDPTYTMEPGAGKDFPAATMTQFSAMQYTKWLSLSLDSYYRLPYECEWEYACRGGTNSAYYFGDDPRELVLHAWIEENA